MDTTYVTDFLFGTLLVGFLVFLNGFFVAAEFAIVKIRDTQLIPLVNRGHRRAKVARRIVRHLDASLSATQLGITLASLGLGWFAEPIFARLLEPVMDWVGVESAQARHSIAFAVGFSVITFLHIVVGELAPKSLAIRKPLPTTVWVAMPLLWFYWASYPFIWLLNSTALWLLRQVGIQPADEAELVHSEEELRLLFADSQQHTRGTTLGREIVLNALDLRRRVAREVMRPRQEIAVLDTKASMSECLAEAERNGYSRFPLCEEGDVDRALGAVHIKDLYAMHRKGGTGADLLPSAHRLIYVPETARLEKLLQLFLQRKRHMALVVDEYGGTEGLVTLENILEELVGQIQDEFDQEKPLLVQIDKQWWEASGALPLHELEELLGEELAVEDVATVSGFLTHKLGRFPKPGDSVTVDAWLLRVESVEGTLVSRLTIESLRPHAPGDEKRK